MYDHVASPVAPRGTSIPNASWYALAVLFVANINSYLDRMVFSFVVEPMRTDFGWSDTQISLLQSAAFGLCYTIFALPLGRLADLKPRRAVIGYGTGLFSCFTIGSGVAQGYGSMFISRMGVGMGEASLLPAAYSMIADLFPRHALARAMGIFTMGAFTGIGLAFVLGGAAIAWALTLEPTQLPWGGEIRSWQYTFFIVGLPGFLIALWVLTLREPVRSGSLANATPPAVAEVWAFLKANKAVFAPAFLGFCVATLSSYASTTWTIAMMVRTYGWSGSEVGYWYGVIYLTMGTLGAVSSGWLADTWRARGAADATLRIAALAMALGAIPSGLAPLMPEGWQAMAMFAPGIFLGVVPFALVAATIQLITPGPIRAQVSASYMFTINLCGVCLGPVLVGLLTDFLFKDPAALRYALALVNGTAGPLAAVILWMALPGLRARLSEEEHSTHER